MNDDDVRLLGIDADRAIVAVNELLDFVVGLFVNVHGISQVECYEGCIRAATGYPLLVGVSFVLLFEDLAIQILSLPMDQSYWRRSTRLFAVLVK
mgnify:CR=1 FL=1